MDPYTSKSGHKILSENYRTTLTIILFISFAIIFFSSLFVIVSLQGEDKLSIFLTAIIGGGTILALILASILTRKIRQDLKDGRVREELHRVEVIYEEDDYEPGSGKLYIPILADLLPRLFGARMNKVVRKFAVTSNHHQYEISKDIKKGESIKLFFGKQSGNYVGYQIL